MRLNSIRGRYANTNTQTSRTTITVANTATDEIAITDAEMPASSPTTIGSCRPIIRNANDSSISCRAFHTAVSCSRVA